ncbi:MAG: sulfotransferase family 2 domain-containing protein [Pirellulaceae bacterium]
MPAFLIHDPRCVFIHNPKTGGQALRHLLLQDGNYEGPVTGQLPESWSDAFSFAIVRNPFDRLVSAWKMFSEGVEDTGWKVPLDLKPGMSLAEFLDIVVDESIGYGDAKRAGKIRVRNHTLPQTHAYYGIDQADFLGRFEYYDRDVQTILDRIGLTSPSPEPRHVTRRGPYHQYFGKVTRHRAADYYAADLERFGYEY